MQITIEMFSGRENPTWTVRGEEATEVLKKLADNPGVAATEPVEGLTGFRGIRIDTNSSSDADRLATALLAAQPRAKGKSEAPPPTTGSLWLANGRAADPAGSASLAEAIVGSKWFKPGDKLYSVDDYGVFDYKFGQRVLQDIEASHPRVQSFLRRRAARVSSADGDPPCGESGEDCKEREWPCDIEVTAQDCDFWNAPQRIRLNNCYAYACVMATDTFPQPGRGSGRVLTSLSCGNVKAAAIRDGLVEYDDCQPFSSGPRFLVALVMAPDEDYHWYRLLDDNSWGHKPGGTEAVNTDDSGVVICDPQTADRGIYTQFCGYLVVPWAVATIL